MDEARIERMASKIAAEQTDDAHSNVDQALDAMVAAFQTIQENLPHVKTENVPQRAALDNIQELMDEAIGPYLADIVQFMQAFGE
jgi:soluble cytochrome b562